jgi:glycosyltransferase involved in cell wall biosynthesis
LRKKRAIVCVTNDLYTDQRVDKVCHYLHEKGLDVLLVGRKLPQSLELSTRVYETHRMNLKFSKGALFYAEYNSRLFFFLLFQKFDFLVSNDLDTLPACDLAASSKGKKIVYDSHEYFTEVPELQNRKSIKFIWEIFETMIFRNLESTYTVNDSIAKIYNEKYKMNFKVVKNLPELQKIEKVKSRLDLNLPNDKKILILQGAGINIDRGAEELTDAMKLVDNGYLIIVGSGDVFPFLEEKIKNDSVLSQRIRLISKLPYNEMMQYTMNADVGLSLDKNTNPNYLYSLPNKIFDYIKAGIPMIVSDLIEISKVVRDFEVGEIVYSHDSIKLAEFINDFFKDENKIELYKQNCQKAMNHLNWDSQKIVLNEIYKKFI